MIRIPGTIPIHIYPIFWILAFAIGWINTPSMAQVGPNAVFLGVAIWVAIVFLSVLIHEYGHALTALAFGQRAHIDLLGFGGLTHRHGKKLKLWKEFLISLNGPLASFLIYLSAMFLLTFMGNSTSLFRSILELTAYANLFWTILNLLPIQPLDGGRLLSIILEGVFGIRGIKTGLLLSAIFAAGIGILAFIGHMLLIGALFMLLAFENFRSWQNMLHVVENDRDDTLQQNMKEAEKEKQKGNDQAAYQQFAHIREVTQKGHLYVTATESMAEILFDQERFQEAYALLQPLKSKLDPKYLHLLHDLAFKVQDWKTVADLSGPVYQEFPGYETALSNAISYALLGQVRPAIGWLQSAIRDGLPNVRAILSKSEFDSIRNTREFQDLQP